MAGQIRLAPTHVCPRCGDWWDVEADGHERWKVSVHENEGSLTGKVWWEEAKVPVCPADTCDLDFFNIILT